MGGARPQYINTGEAGSLNGLDTDVDSQLPYANYFSMPYDRFTYNDVYQTQDLQRQRRTIDESKTNKWYPNQLDIDKSLNIQAEGKVAPNPFIIEGYIENQTGLIIPSVVEKKSFSPWGGKRDNPFIEQTWTWKRAANIKEPSMPKRVRFSPWGGKRSGQVIYKPGTKGSKLIFSSAVPELTKIVSNYSPNGESMNLAGFQILPVLDKRHPIRVLALSAKVGGGSLKEALPFRDFMEVFPKFFKPGHPYADVNMKKDGKRKVKFSAWGGKRAPPIIGPIWTPAFHTAKEHAQIID